MNWKVIAGVGTVLGTAIGAAAGYFVAKKRLENYYAEYADMEIAEAKEYYSTFYKSGEDSTPEGALAKRHPGLALKEAVAETPNIELTDEVVEAPDPEVLQRIVKKLNYGTPTTAAARVGPPEIISKEEYFENVWQYSQTSITYYSDGALVDEDEDLVENVDLTVGLHNLKQFGKRSRDPNVVYIRNDRVRVLYEICKNDLKYSEVVDIQGA